LNVDALRLSSITGMTPAPRVRSFLIAPEVLIVIGCVATLALWSLPPLIGLWVGGTLALGALVGGALAGVVYHVQLHRALAPMRTGWWWNPTREHGRLDDPQRRRVMPWFFAGAAGFAGAIAGSVAFLSAALRL
jgi:hypothetical protein